MIEIRTLTIGKHVHGRGRPWSFGGVSKSARHALHIRSIDLDKAPHCQDTRLVVRSQQCEEFFQSMKIVCSHDRMVQHDAYGRARLDAIRQHLADIVKRNPCSLPLAEKIDGNRQFMQFTAIKWACSPIARQSTKAECGQAVGCDLGAPVPRRREDRISGLAQKVGQSAPAIFEVSKLLGQGTGLAELAFASDGFVIGMAKTMHMETKGAVTTACHQGCGKLASQIHRDHGQVERHVVARKKVYELEKLTVGPTGIVIAKEESQRPCGLVEL